MNRADRAVYWTLTRVVPASWHRHFPHWLKVILNRWMKHRGDPGDRRRR